MDAMSLAEVVLHGIAEESGVMPEGGLLERLEQSPPGTLRRLARLDGEVLELCGLAPLELGGVLTGLMADGTTEGGRIDPERAWDAVVAARTGGAPPDPDAVAERLLALAHAALGLAPECSACAEWEPPADEADDGEDADADGEDEADDGEDGEEHDHHGPTSLVDRVFDVHADGLDTWEAQVGLRIAMDAGENLAEIAGFEILHDVVGHARGVPGVSPQRRTEIHTVQHVGMSLCIDAAQVQGLRVAAQALAPVDEGVAARMDAAEQAAAEESGVLAAVAATVVVERLAPRVTAVLEQAPPSSPPNRPARARRRRR